MYASNASLCLFSQNALCECMKLKHDCDALFEWEWMTIATYSVNENEFILTIRCKHDCRAFSFREWEWMHSHSRNENDHDKNSHWIIMTILIEFSLNSYGNSVREFFEKSPIKETIFCKRDLFAFSRWCLVQRILMIIATHSHDHDHFHWILIEWE